MSVTERILSFVEAVVVELNKASISIKSGGFEAEANGLLGLLVIVTLAGGATVIRRRLRPPPMIDVTPEKPTPPKEPLPIEQPPIEKPHDSIR